MFKIGIYRRGHHGSRTDGVGGKPGSENDAWVNLIGGIGAGDEVGWIIRRTVRDRYILVAGVEDTKCGADDCLSIHLVGEPKPRCKITKIRVDKGTAIPVFTRIAGVQQGPIEGTRLQNDIRVVI